MKIYNSLNDIREIKNENLKNYLIEYFIEFFDDIADYYNKTIEEFNIEIDVDGEKSDSNECPIYKIFEIETLEDFNDPRITNYYKVNESILEDIDDEDPSFIFLDRVICDDGSGYIMFIDYTKNIINKDFTYKIKNIQNKIMHRIDLTEEEKI